MTDGGDSICAERRWSCDVKTKHHEHQINSSMLLQLHPMDRQTQERKSLVRAALHCDQREFQLSALGEEGKCANRTMETNEENPMTKEPKHQCPECRGSGRIIAWDGYVLGECVMCRGLKTIPEHQLEWIAAGRALREQRISRRITLRDMATLIGVGVVDLSQVERGLIEPSSAITTP